MGAILRECNSTVTEYNLKITEKEKHLKEATMIYFVTKLQHNSLQT